MQETNPYYTMGYAYILMDSSVKAIDFCNDILSTQFLQGRLVSVLEEHRLNREQKEEEKRRYRDQKKLESILLKEKEAIFGSKPSPKRTISLNRGTNGYRSTGNSNGLMTPNPRRSSIGGATPELLTPRSCSGRYNRYFGDSRRLSATQLNFGDDSLSTFTSISGSEPESPSLG
ncbi:hypothetical protein GUJ93_ZPchr0009g1271 [Zizania palustris]|uniref:Uncharacterized protein n=1 Tax=Zizania palustris TaxID=103762 RepID=A0A8J5RPA5_ZIZPA|nr:hypothetical protein GUJ93_ZPchr0009g1271 [Zizania palustris]